MEMSDKSAKILKEYLKDASPGEAEELYRLLDEREKSKKRSGGRAPLKVNIDEMARDMSKQIQEQMGMTNINIKRMAVDLIVKMARQHEPNISDRELKVLIEQMIPDLGAQNSSSDIPDDVMKTMILQFVTFSTGEMSEREKRDMPLGWTEKYWGCFSPKIRQLISYFLKGGIDKKAFWGAVNIYLDEARPSPKARKRRRPIPPGPRKNPY